jgi:hypothetical protein
MATQFGQVSVQLLDALGVTVSMPLYIDVDDTKTIAQLITDATAAGTQVDSVSDSQVTKITVSLNAPLAGGLKTTPNATAENERTGLLNFRQTGSPYKFGVDIPAIAEATLVNGKIDLSNAQIAAFITFLTTAHTVFTYVSTAIKALISLVDALLTFRKHRKAESRRSFEVAP